VGLAKLPPVDELVEGRAEFEEEVSDVDSPERGIDNLGGTGDLDSPVSAVPLPDIEHHLRRHRPRRWSDFAEEPVAGMRDRSRLALESFPLVLPGRCQPRVRAASATSWR
jgi:hypothetical protein